uniref:Uncharacterized protein n=1 Tax=Arion vulgaris TaxID=1028688 RepID=A0A0B6ZII4_9EUPU
MAIATKTQQSVQALLPKTAARSPETSCPPFSVHAFRNTYTVGTNKKECK